MLNTSINRRKAVFLSTLIVSATVTSLCYIFYEENPAPIRLFLESKQSTMAPKQIVARNLSSKLESASIDKLSQAEKSWKPMSSLFLYAELDKKFLINNFDRVKQLVKPLSRKYASKVDQLMVHRLPVIDTKHWMLHRPTGENLSVETVQHLLRDPNYKVPSAVHYILPFSDPVLQFHHLVCILSGVWVLRPDHVIFWYSKEPKGENWDLLKRNLTVTGVWHTKVLMAHRSVPKSVYSQPVQIREHQSDIIRMEALLVFGGVYSDIDVISLKSMQPLRNYSFTIGRELPQNLCNGVFLSAPNSTLLALWHVAYQTLDDSGWGEHSLMLPNRLCNSFAKHCHVENESMDRPNFMWYEIVWIYGKKRGWDWRKKNYAMHLWYRMHKKQYNMESIKYVDSMLGDMFRFVLYGNSSLQLGYANYSITTSPRV